MTDSWMHLTVVHLADRHIYNILHLTLAVLLTITLLEDDYLQFYYCAEFYYSFHITLSTTLLLCDNILLPSRGPVAACIECRFLRVYDGCLFLFSVCFFKSLHIINCYTLSIVTHYDKTLSHISLLIISHSSLILLLLIFLFLYSLVFFTVYSHYSP